LSELTIRIEGIDPVDFFVFNNSRLKLLKKAFPRLKIVSRGDQIKTAGQEEDIERLRSTVGRIIDHIDRFGAIDESKLENILFNEEALLEESAKADKDEVLVYGSRGNIVKARTPNQKKLVTASDNNDVVFAIGPAGTGKTYTAVALAVSAL
jgi:phosphate starvation-inducible PhoH-like protein